MTAGAGSKQALRVGKFDGRAVIAQAAVRLAPWSRLVKAACRFMLICMLGWLLLALLAIDFGTFRHVGVLHAVPPPCSSLTLQLICRGQQLEQLAMAAPGFTACNGVGLACCVQR